MRKLKLLMQSTINGFVGEPAGGNAWMTWNPDPGFMHFLQSHYDSSDTLLLGRKLGEGFIDYWAKTAVDEPEHPLASRITAKSKIIFSKTMQGSDRPRTTVERGDLAEAIAALKKREGKDILVVGGAEFAASVIGADLLDELHLVLNPTAMAAGLTIFNALKGIKQFTPVQAKLHAGGKVLLTYVPKRNEH
jgi:dihydrofolate reductase